jgi:hypothetical protein
MPSRPRSLVTHEISAGDELTSSQNHNNQNYRWSVGRYHFAEACRNCARNGDFTLALMNSAAGRSIALTEKLHAAVAAAATKRG